MKRLLSRKVIIGVVIALMFFGVVGAVSSYLSSCSYI